MCYIILYNYTIIHYYIYVIKYINISYIIHTYLFIANSWLTSKSNGFAWIYYDVLKTNELIKNDMKPVGFCFEMSRFPTTKFHLMCILQNLAWSYIWLELLPLWINKWTDSSLADASSLLLGQTNGHTNISRLTRKRVDVGLSSELSSLQHTIWLFNIALENHHVQ